ncbi:unnamed protein product [Rhizophagus irregularis]|nr:unnamed protein product [Rhizophagus irregularis]
MKQIFKVFFVMLVFIVAVMATPVPIQKRQEATEPTETTEPTDQGDQSGQSNQNSQSSADPCSESALDDNVPTTSEGQDVKLYIKKRDESKMQQIFKVFILFAFIIAVIAIPVPVQKRQGHNCPPSSPEINQSDTFPVSSDPKSPDGLKPFNCP